MAATSEPNPVDIHVGERIRMRRKFLGLSQETLADAINLTFQQVQKYERGSNRVSASKLYQIAEALRTPLAYFFEGYNDGGSVTEFSESTSERFVHGFLTTTEGIELAASFPHIRNPKHRRKVLDLVRSLADDESAPFSSPIAEAN